MNDPYATHLRNGCGRRHTRKRVGFPLSPGGGMHVQLHPHAVFPYTSHPPLFFIQGANDTVNPSAVEDPNSPIAGVCVFDICAIVYRFTAYYSWR